MAPIIVNIFIEEKIKCQSFFMLEGYISASKKIPDIALYSESSIDSLKNLVSSLRQGKDCCEVEENVYYAGYAPRDCKNIISK